MPQSRIAANVAPPRLRLSLPPDPARLLRARDRIREYLLSHCPDRGVVDDVVLCIEEACTNVIRHSDVGDGMEISLEFTGDALECEVKDRGRGFDISAFDPERMPDPLATGGRGLFLIAHLMDDLELRNDGGLAVRMTKRDVRQRPVPTLAAGIDAPTETLALAHETRQRALLEEIDEAFFALDWEYRYVHANEAAQAITQRTLDELLGHTPWELFPKLRGSELEDRYHKAMELGRPAVLEHVSVLTGDWLEIRIYPTASGVSAFYRQINDRKSVEAELLASRESLSTILGTITDAFFTLDRDWRITFINDKAADVFGQPRETIIGSSFWDLLPGAAGSAFDLNKRTAMEDGVFVSFEAYYEPFDLWFEERDYPSAEGITVLFTDITRRKRAELDLQRLLEESQAQSEELHSQSKELQLQTDELRSRGTALELSNAGLAEAHRLSAALARLNQSLTSTFDLDEILHRAVTEGVQTLGSNAGVLEIREGECWVVKEVIGLEEGLVGLRLSDKEASIASAMAERRDVLVIADAVRDERANASTIWRYGTKAALAVPLTMRDEILGSLQFIYTTEPRSFSEPEVDFATKLATAIALALENTRLFNEAVAHEHLSSALTDIATSITSLVDHNAILTRVVGQAGQALSAESASICTVRGEDLVPTHVWQLPPEVIGVPIPRTRTPYVDIGIETRRTIAIDDCETDPRVDRELQREWGVRSVMMAPLLAHGDVVGAVFLNYHAVEHTFTTAEIDFIGRVAALVSGALENTRLHEEQARREQALDDILLLASGFHAEDSYDHVAQAVCASARSMFDCTSVSLYRLEEDLAQLIGRAPESEPSAVGDTISLDRLMPGRTALARPQYAESPESATRAAGKAGHATAARPALLVPVGVPGRRDKLLTLSWANPDDEPSIDEFVVVQRFADQVELALSQASRRAAQDESAALYGRLEASLLPRVPITHPDVRILSAYRTGEQRLRLGGDFFDVMACGQGWLAIGIGDVCGHGPDAAALGATLRANWRGLNLSGADLTTTMNSLESLLLLERLTPEVFVTFVGAWLDPRVGHLHFVSAGHPAPLLIADKVEPLLANPGLPLGIHFGTRRWEANEVELPDQWHLLFYTDGLIEGRAAPDSTERYGIKRLAAQLRREAHAGFRDDCLDRMVAEVEAAHGGPLPDDAAAVLISRL